MTILEELLGLSSQESLGPIYRDLASLTDNKLLGLYVWDTEAPCILLDKSLMNNYRKQVCTLSEELGHHFAGVRRNFLVTDNHHDRIIVAKDEVHAMRWATDRVIPDAKLAHAVEDLKLRSCWELADYFEVTQPFMWRKLGFLRNCFRATGIKVRSRDIFTIKLAPCFSYSCR